MKLKSRFNRSVGNVKKSVQKSISRLHSRNPLVFGVFLGAFGLWSLQCSVSFISMKLQLVSESEKSLYTLGQLYARRIESMRLTRAEAKTVALGFQDWAGEKRAQVDYESNRAGLQTLTAKRHDEQVKISQAEGQEYLKEFVKEGALVSLSGLAYRILAPGSSKKPTLKDSVQVSYQGKLVNGKIVDSADGKDGKASLPMIGVIKGWTEGLQLIGEGGEIELVIPSDLGYGDAGTLPDVPPGATLVFRIQLHKIVDPRRVKPQ